MMIYRKSIDYHMATSIYLPDDLKRALLDAMAADRFKAMPDYIQHLLAYRLTDLHGAGANEVWQHFQTTIAPILTHLAEALKPHDLALSVQLDPIVGKLEIQQHPVPRQSSRATAFGTFRTMRWANYLVSKQHYVILKNVRAALADGIAGNRFNHTALSALKDNQRKVLSAPKLLEWLVLWEVGDDLNILIKSDESQVLSELYQFVDQVLTAKKVIGDLQFSDRDVSNILIDTAWEEPLPRRAVQWCHSILELFPDCADAYVILANRSSSVDSKRELYTQGIEAGHRELGSAYFAEHVGHFWGDIDTRPYMRALSGLALVEWEMGNLKQALAHYRHMLFLNPSDNQGARYCLLHCLIEAREFADLELLFRTDIFKDHIQDDLSYARALMTFCQLGDGPDAQKMLKRAQKINPYTALLLLGQPIPAIDERDVTAQTSLNMAENYAEYAKRTWLHVPGALTWLATISGRTHRKSKTQ